MDITKRDSKMLKGVAILAMLMLHLFCRKDNLPYTPLLWVGDTPLIYYFGLFGDICVAIYCFVSGYAHLYTILRNRTAATLEAPSSIFALILGDCGGVLVDWYTHRRFCDSWQCKGVSHELPYY